MSVWSLPMKQFIDKYSKCPNISFRAIDIVDKPLRGHIDGGTNINVLKIFPKNLSRGT